MRRAGWLLVLLLAVPAASRAAAADLRAVSLPSKALAMAPARDAQGAPGLALLFAEGEERSLRFLDPATGRLEVLAAKLPEEVVSLHSFDFGNGPQLVLGARGALYSVGKEGALEKLLEDPGFEPQSLRGFTGTLKGALPVARAGRLDLLFPAGSSLEVRASFPLPVKAERKSWGLSLTSPSVSVLPGAGEEPALFAAGPVAHGKRRLLTMLFSPGGGEPVEAWSQLPAEEILDQSRFLRIDGRPALMATAYEKIGIFQKKRVRVFFLEKDRSRGGTPPVLATETECPAWGRLDIVAADMDGDSRQDLALMCDRGIVDHSLRVAVHRGLGGGKFEARPRIWDQEIDARDWLYAPGLTEDGRPGLMVLNQDGLVVYGLEAKGKPLTPRPVRNLAVGPVATPETVHTVAVGAGTAKEGEEGGKVLTMETLEIRSLQKMDVTGDGQEEILVRSEGKDGQTTLLVVRQMP
ncbi:MAG TPA: hypothetical protein VG477_16965 [Thermoanaerobaculia bacterium]|nr:hypothetical protein [Thermoanaerobaculia bacterium]